MKTQKSVIFFSEDDKQLSPINQYQHSPPSISEFCFYNAGSNTSAQIQHKKNANQMIQNQNKECVETKQGARRKKESWTSTEESELFYATLKFSIQHPYHVLSWNSWKPQRYYPYLSKHLKDIFGEQGGRNPDQCKVKVQYFKKLWYNDKNQKLDLNQLCSKKLQIWIQGKRSLGSDIQLNEEESDRLQRFTKILNNSIKVKYQINQSQHLIDSINEFMSWSAQNKAKIDILSKKVSSLRKNS